MKPGTRLKPQHGFPCLEQVPCGGDIAQAVFGDGGVLTGVEEVADLGAVHPGGFGRGDTEGLRIEVEVELAGGAAGSPLKECEPVDQIDVAAVVELRSVHEIT